MANSVTAVQSEAQGVRQTKRWNRERLSRRTSRALFVGFTFLLALTFALPLIWLVTGSLKTDREIFHLPPIWIPNPAQWGNYPAAVKFIPFALYLGNTLILCTGRIIGSLISCTMVAYGFSRFRWPGRDALFMVVISTMMVPYAVTMIPLFIIFKHLNWVGTYLPLIVPAFFGSPFLIFLLRQFFLTIPLELSDAAEIDGANELRMMWHIVLPLARPALAMVVLFEFMGTWATIWDRSSTSTDPVATRWR